MSSRRENSARCFKSSGVHARLLRSADGWSENKLHLVAEVLKVLTELRARQFRAAVPAEGMEALAGRNHGLRDEQRKGVHRAGLVHYEHHLLPLGLLVNEYDGVFEPAQRFRREGAEGID